MAKEYTYYKGEELISIGTIKELAKNFNVKEDSIRFYSTPSYINRLKDPDKSVVVVCIDE